MTTSRCTNAIRSIVHMCIKMNGGILIYNSTGLFCGSQGGLGLLSRRASGGIVVGAGVGGLERVE